MGLLTKRKNFPHREYFGKKRFYVLFKTDSKNNGKNIRVEQTKKQKKNCSIQHGDDCQTEIDSYLDSFFVPLITQTVPRDSGRVPRVMTDSVLWEGGDCQHLHLECPQTNLFHI